MYPVDLALKPVFVNRAVDLLNGLGWSKEQFAAYEKSRVQVRETGLPPATMKTLIDTKSMTISRPRGVAS
jgi:hypothetical protein